VGGWSKDDREVPQPNAGYHWSVSHKQHLACAVIADVPVGIDVEHVTARPRGLHDRLAEPADWDALGDRSWASFYLLWTAKEAVLKAVGVGIAGFLRCRLVELPDDRRMRLTYEGRTWTIEHYHHADHVLAVTCDAEPVRWCVLDGMPEGKHQVQSTPSSTDD
jgi:phosphopantetheinyl transferase